MLSWRATMIAGKDLLNQFKAASWKDPDEMDAFIDSVEAPEASGLLKILDIVSAKTADDNQHRARLVVFGRLIYMTQDKALFGPFVKALKGAEPALRSTLAALLPKVNSPTDHAGLVDHLRASDTGLRATVARTLQQLGGTRTLYDLLTRAAGEPNFACRVEALDVIVAFAKHQAIPALQAALQVGTPAEKLHAVKHLGNAAVLGQHPSAA